MSISQAPREQQASEGYTSRLSRSQLGGSPRHRGHQSEEGADFEAAPPLPAPGLGLALSHLGVGGRRRARLRRLGGQRHGFLVGRQDHLGGTKVRAEDWPEGTTPLTKGCRGWRTWGTLLCAGPGMHPTGVISAPVVNRLVSASSPLRVGRQHTFSLGKRSQSICFQKNWPHPSDGGGGQMTWTGPLKVELHPPGCV